MVTTGAYSNLIGEIAKAHLYNTDVANTLQIHPNTLRKKLNGESAFDIEEAFSIKRNFFPDLPIDYLFARTPTQKQEQTSKPRGR